MSVYEADFTPPASSWAPVDLAGIIDAVQRGEVVGPVPEFLPRTDGVALLYPGEVHSFAGEPESGKGWLIAAECARLIAAGERVVYVDFEDSARSIVGRLLALDAQPRRIVELFRYIRPRKRGPTTP